jgi:electron transport complex protein RnfG
VDQDDGAFDTITGATVTSRAVVTAVKGTLLYFEQHSDEIYSAAAAAASGSDDELE